MLVFFALAPNLGFLFLSIPFLVFGFGSLRISGVAWFVVALASGAILYRTHEVLLLTRTPPFEYVLVWISFMTTVARLTALRLLGGF
jgi:hypothetical protein